MTDKNIDKVADKYISFREDSYTLTEERVEKYAVSMKTDGSWDDIDYEGVKIPFWKSVEHFDRLNVLALSKKHDAEVIRGLEFWYSKERRDTNWWWNDIGFPMHAAICAILVRKEMCIDLRKRICDTFNEDIEEGWTGTNYAWFAQNIIVRGIVEGNAKLIKRGKDYLESEVRLAEWGEEGIQPDYAFAQHGRQLYNNGYGYNIIMDCGKWIDVFSDTEFSFSKEKIDIVTDFTLDGCGKMCFCAVPDFNTIGRDIVRGYKGRDLRMQNILPAISVLKKNSNREEELNKLEEYIKGNSKAIEFTKMFSSLNIFTNLRNGFYSSVRFGSKYVLGADICGGKIVNGEDKLSAYRGCFVSQYMITGKEYDRIFPLWNWAFLPGVTCPETELETEQGAVMSSTFAGGISNDKYGVCAIDLNEDFSCEDTVKFGGKKACFFMDDELIHLGCGLYSETTLNTTLNQCLFDEGFTVDGQKYEKECVCKNADYILHGNIGYVFSDKTNVKVCAETRSGLWNRITDMHEQIKAEGDVFTAYIPHTDTDRYEYAVVPYCDKEKAENYKMPFYINTPKVQAVLKNNIICAVFYEKDSITIENIEVSADNPCFVITDGTDISVSVPEGFDKANVKLNYKEYKKYEN